MQATEGEAAAGRPTVEIEGRQYRFERRRYRLGAFVRTVVSADGRQTVVEIYEPVGER